MAVTAEPKWQLRSFVQETTDFELSVLHELLDGETVVLRREKLSDNSATLLSYIPTDASTDSGYAATVPAQVSISSRQGLRWFH